jgi:hypothetical protein
MRVFYYSWQRGNPSNLRLRKRIHVPAAFDPATILYPTTLPVIISISLFSKTSVTEYTTFTRRATAAINTFQTRHTGILEPALAIVHTTTNCCREHRHSVEAVRIDTLQATLHTTRTWPGSRVASHTICAPSSSATSFILSHNNESATHRASSTIHRTDQPPSILRVSTSRHPQDAAVAGWSWITRNLQ